MEKLNIKDVARKLAERDLGATIKENEQFLRGLVEVINEELEKGNEVAFYGLGIFTVKEVAERKGRNPQTGEEITIEAHNSPKFKFSSSVKELVR